MIAQPSAEATDHIVRLALAEDAPWGDITTQTFIAATARITAQLVAREPGVLCGQDLFTRAMAITGPVTTTFHLSDAEPFTKGQALATLEGPAQAVLQAERVALNFLQRLSGIATLTSTYVAAATGTKTRIVDTRKTTPGLRLFERYAVRCGGGHNHRFSLSDAVLLKDNHLAVLAASVPDIAAAIRAQATQLPHTTHLEIEVDRVDQIEPALAAGARTVMLDNFSAEDLRTGIELINGRALVEVSGGVTLDRIPELAAAGVDILSVGALTHTARWLDIGLDILP
jgi:nicotinate-nucleotide pyrophosphorylase (carboxylating)